MKEQMNLQNSDWFSSLTEDIRSAFVEGYKAYEEVKIMTMHTIGKRIITDNDFKRAESYGQKILQTLARSSEISERTLYRCKAFAEKYPDFKKYLSSRPPNWTWNKTIKQLEGVKDCEEHNWVNVILCSKCRKRKDE